MTTSIPTFLIVEALYINFTYALQLFVPLGTLTSSSEIVLKYFRVCFFAPRTKHWQTPSSCTESLRTHLRTLASTTFLTGIQVYNFTRLFLIKC